MYRGLSIFAFVCGLALTVEAQVPDTISEEARAFLVTPAPEIVEPKSPQQWKEFQQDLKDAFAGASEKEFE